MRIRDDALHCHVRDDETVVLDTRRSRYFELNRTGSLLWPLLATGATLDELVERLTEVWRVDRELAVRDVEAFCSALATAELLDR